jgi:succinate dehydrogenase / fumarate reductase, iron-sulfur subunit
MLTVEIYRFRPDTDQKPSTMVYRVETLGKNLMVLDILERIKEDDTTLAFRRSCREGVCGSDGMNINGKNRLACITSISDALGAQGDTLQIRPLPGLPVIRDLVVDMTLFWKQYEKIRPYVINDTVPIGIERLQSPEDRAKLDGLYQ